MVTIDSLFGLHQMGESVDLFRSPKGELRLQELFTPEDCYGNVYRFDREDFEMSLPPAVGGRDSASIAVKAHDKKPEFISLAYFRISKTLSSASLFTTRAPGELTDNAVGEIAKIKEGHVQRLQLGIEALCAQAMRGAYAVTPANFPDSQVSLSFNRAVTNLTGESASWATDSTKIVSTDILAWKRDMKQAGSMLDHLIFNKKITGYILKNTEAQAWLTQTQRGVQTFEAAQFGRMGGVSTWEEYEGWYKPEGGSATPFVSDDEIFALPNEAMRRKHFRLIQGFGEIPNEAIGSGGGAPAGAVKAPTAGIFQFALPTGGDPAGIKIVSGWYGLPIIKIPTVAGYEASVIA